jgi:uncharacterized protein (UPF0332 family)
MDISMPHDNSLLINYRVSRAKETIDDARIAIENDRLHAAENRIYYAIFYIVSALALKDDYTTSRHGQLLGWFNKNFVKTGILSSDIGKIYADAFENRQESDYQDYIKLDAADVSRHYTEMLKFIKEVEKLLI